MNTNKLKAYAPKARIAFMDAVEKKAATLGLYTDRIADMSTDGDNAVIEGRIFTRKQGQQRNQLVRRINELGTTNGKLDLELGFKQFVNETAFTWFNRLTAIRFMEINDYLDHGYRVLSKGENALFGEGFEILGAAADIADDLGLNKDQIIDMVLDGGKEEELYRTILLGQCHQLSGAMPQIFGGIGFEKLDDATELLLPDNLTKTDSILKDLINEVPEDNWTEIEVIGWLYQFYISEYKDTVIGKVVKTEDIPAATQLFTPNWIVKYMVHNSLGRKWLATYPDSELKDKMEYYINPAEQSEEVIEQLKAITPKSIDPETIKVIDPACGSGHILVEVYDVLREIYLELDYRPREIPELILTKNIFALDIDDRAVQMASFALLMKAREDDKRIFSRDITLNIHSIQSTESWDVNQLWNDLDLEGQRQTGSTADLFASNAPESINLSDKSKRYIDLLNYLKETFIEAKSLGSLIQIDAGYSETVEQLKSESLKKLSSNSQVAELAAQQVLPVLYQAQLLATTYDVTVANPPYNGSKYQTPKIKKYLKDNFKGYEKDLFSAFIARNLQLTNKHGELGFMTPFVWMFISSYEKLRSNLINKEIISTLVQLEYSGFDGATVPICTFTLTKGHIPNYKGSYIRLSEFKGAANQGPKTLEAIHYSKCNYLFEAKSDDFSRIPGNPIAYWASESTFSQFGKSSLGEIGKVRQGLLTSNNDRFLRRWTEVSISKTGLNLDRESARLSGKKWFPINKGGDYRRWYGNLEFVVNWENDGEELHNFIISKYDYLNGNSGLVLKRGNPYFEPAVTWTDISSSYFGARYMPKGMLYEKGGSCAYYNNNKVLLACLCSNVTTHFLRFLSPTLHYQVGDIANLPVIDDIDLDTTNEIEMIHDRIVNISKLDWDSQETSWDFNTLPLVNYVDDKNLEENYNALINDQNNSLYELKNLEERNNTIFTMLFGLTDELECEMQLKSLTLSTNPHFNGKRTDSDSAKELIRQSKTFIELLSFCIGCIMGRYSLDTGGLLYANSGNSGFKELVSEHAYKSYAVDDDGIVPLADEEWIFEDDATIRFREFVKTVWGEEHLQENLDFVAESLCLDAIKAKKNESSMDTIRRYFSTQFFKDHVKTYKKRPIYWLFSSGKAKAFECLVYLHRYNESTLSRMRTEYVTPLMGKLESHKGILEDSKPTASGAELRAIDKELKTIEKKQAELATFDEELKHLSEMKISLDLDNGVKENYGKFGNLLADAKAIHGKKPAEIK
ncbi:BREX-1 system adenine-specific DNA-methyltransferase PglX [Vibrio rarus]|uniref:BREX-1 system adenine-specific DNA-methyltransferase PglX n=1 Tax=Vibrio rarus TaxID=413403 RepID=UPI0039E77991